MPKPTRRQLARLLTQTNAKLADPTLEPANLEILEERAEKLRVQLVGSCSHCGRTLRASDSVRLGIGPVCAHQAVSA